MRKTSRDRSRVCRALCLFFAFLSPVLLACLPSIAQAPTAAKSVAEAYDRIEQTVLKQYPKATVKRENGFLLISYNTRKFMVHNRLKTGEWQTAVEQEGPDNGGILCSVSGAPGPWTGAAMVPQTFDYRYYQSLLMAPYSKSNNYHLTAHLNYPDNVNQAFVRDFREAVSKFADDK